jgi:hypothetical protein
MDGDDLAVCAQVAACLGSCDFGTSKGRRAALEALVAKNIGSGDHGLSCLTVRLYYELLMTRLYEYEFVLRDPKCFRNTRAKAAALCMHQGIRGIPLETRATLARYLARGSALAASALAQALTAVYGLPRDLVRLVVRAAQGTAP